MPVTRLVLAMALEPISLAEATLAISTRNDEWLHGSFAAEMIPVLMGACAHLCALAHSCALASSQVVPDACTSLELNEALVEIPMDPQQACADDGNSCKDSFPSRCPRLWAMCRGAGVGHANWAQPARKRECGRTILRTGSV